MFNLIDNYSFIPASGCMGRGPSSLLCPEVYYDVKVVLNTPSYEILSTLNLGYALTT